MTNAVTQQSSLLLNQSLPDALSGDEGIQVCKVN